MVMSAVLTLSVAGGVPLDGLGSVVHAAPTIAIPFDRNEAVEPATVGIVANHAVRELDEVSDTADALCPSNGSVACVAGVDVSPTPGEFDANDSAAGPLSLGDDRIAQTGGVLDPLFQFLFPVLQPTTDGLPVDLTGIELSWSGGDDERLGIASASLSQFIRPTMTNIVIGTLIDYIVTGYYISPTLTYVTGLLMPMPIFQPVYNYFPSLTPVPPTFRFHQVQGLNSAEMIEMAIAQDPTNPQHVRDVVLNGYMPGIVPGLWSQPSGVGDGSLSVDSTHNCVRSCVSLNGKQGGLGVCNTVLEYVGAPPPSPDAGTINVSLEHFADGTYEVDFTIMTTYRLKGTGSRVFVSITGAPSITVDNPDDTVLTGRRETSVTKTVTISADNSVPAISWTPTISFPSGSLGKSIEVDGHIVVSGVRRISVP